MAFVDLTDSDHGEKKDPEARKKKTNLNKVHFLSLLSLYSLTAGKEGSRVSQVKDTQNPCQVHLRMPTSTNTSYGDRGS